MAALASHMFTWSNALTVLRLVASPFFLWALLGGLTTLAALLFWVAVATDVADGRIARARGEDSAFGGILDHVSDATFVALGLAGLAWQGGVPVVLPVLVAAAFAQYVLDSPSAGRRMLRASALGRWNGILYFVPLGIVVTREWLGLAWPADTWVYALGAILVGSTLLSMVDRARVRSRACRGA